MDKDETKITKRKFETTVHFLQCTHTLTREREREKREKERERERERENTHTETLVCTVLHTFIKQV